MFFNNQSSYGSFFFLLFFIYPLFPHFYLNVRYSLAIISLSLFAQTYFYPSCFFLLFFKKLLSPAFFISLFSFFSFLLSIAFSSSSSSVPPFLSSLCYPCIPFLICFLVKHFVLRKFPSLVTPYSLFIARYSPLHFNFILLFHSSTCFSKAEYF